jgi:hypothetical protein
MVVCGRGRTALWLRNHPGFSNKGKEQIMTQVNARNCGVSFTALMGAAVCGFLVAIKGRDTMFRLTTCALAALAAASYLGTIAAANAAGYKETDLVVGCDPNDPINQNPTKCFPAAKKLIDANGIPHSAQIFDPDLLNAWGLTESTTDPTTMPPSVGSPFWVSDNASGKSTLYAVPPGSNPPTATKNARIVSIPSPNDPSGGGTPTGNAWNPTSRAAACIAPKCTPQFKITGYLFTATVTSATPPVGIAATCSATPTTPASFLFATEDGTIVGWSSTLFPATPAGLAACQTAAAAVPGKVNPNVTPNNTGIIAVDNSQATDGKKGKKGKKGSEGAVYKSLAVVTAADGTTILYAANFRAGSVEVYDGGFNLVDTGTDKKAAKDGNAPFNIVPIKQIGGEVDVFITFAVQDAAKHDDVKGAGHGIVDRFDLNGKQKLERFAEGGVLNSPWGMVLTPAPFGDFTKQTIWIGNFGDGRINAFDPGTGAFLGTVNNNATGNPIVIDGLWALSVGNDGNGGSSQKVYFTAGPNDEANGLFGALSP